MQRQAARAWAEFKPALGGRQQRAAALRDGVAYRGAAGQFAVEVVEQDLGGGDMHRVAHGQHAGDAGLDQPGRNGIGDHRLHRRAVAGRQHHQGNLVLGQQVAKSVGGHEIGLGITAAVVGLLEAQRTELLLRHERAVAVEMHHVVAVTGLLGGAQHLAHARQRRRAAEIELHRCAQRVECGEQRLGGEPGVYEAGIFGPADDVENAQRQRG